MAIVRAYVIPGTDEPSDLPETCVGQYRHTDDAIDTAEWYARRFGVWTQVETDQGRPLGKYGPGGEHEHLGY